MISDKMQEAMNKQINAELWSSYLYLSMAAYFDSVNLSGSANWMKCQAQEELTHAVKFYNYVVERGGRVKLSAVDNVPTEWDTPLKVFEDTYEHETKVTAMIHNLVDMANQEKDYASIAFLQWFITEQVEEEASADEIVQKLKLAGDRGAGLFMIDRELGARVFTLPVQGEE